MTTSNLSLEESLGTRVGDTAFRTSGLADFTTSCMAIQALLDYASVVVGMSLAYNMYRALVPVRTAALSWPLSLSVAGAFALITVFVLFFLDGYKPDWSPINIRDTANVIRSVAFSFTAVAIGVFFQFGAAALSIAVLLAGIVVLGVLLLERALYLILLRRMNGREIGVQRVLLMGTRYAGTVCEGLKRNPRSRLVPAGLVLAGSAAGREGPIETEKYPSSLKLLGSWREAERIIVQRSVREIIVVDELEEDQLEAVAQDCERLQVGLSIFRPLTENQEQIFRYEPLDGMPVARLRSRAKSAVTDAAKRLLDVAVSSVLCVLLLPVFCCIALLVRLDSGAPVLFRQERVGKDGRIFRMLKFRSMYVDSPRFSRSPSTSDDPRITRFGRILRRTSLDELPQLWNVITGDMSLVGPRPEMPYVVEGYGAVERMRLLVKPGITGLWQISSARSMPIHENMEYDLFYVEHKSVFLDMAILISTIGAVLRGIGAC